MTSFKIHTLRNQTRIKNQQRKTIKENLSILQCQCIQINPNLKILIKKNHTENHSSRIYGFHWKEVCNATKKTIYCALVESHGVQLFFVKSLCSDGLHNNVQIGIKNLKMKEIIYLSRGGFEPHTHRTIWCQKHLNHQTS